MFTNLIVPSCYLKETRYLRNTFSMTPEILKLISREVEYTRGLGIRWAKDSEHWKALLWVDLMDWRIRKIEKFIFL